MKYNSFFMIYSFLFKMINAPITPGIQPQSVSKKTISTDPHPRSITANGGKMMANNTCKQDIIQLVLFFKSCPLGVILLEFL